MLRTKVSRTGHKLFFLMYGKWPKRAPPPNQRGGFSIYIRSYREVLKIIFHFLWQSETTQNYYKKFRIFFLPKIRFSKNEKQGKITTKNFAYFLTKKMSFKNNVNLLLKI